MYTIYMTMFEYTLGSFETLDKAKRAGINTGFSEFQVYDSNMNLVGYHTFAGWYDYNSLGGDNKCMMVN